MHFVFCIGKKTRARKSTFRLYPRSEQYEYPEEADVDFYWEKLFLSNMDKIIGEYHYSLYSCSINNNKFVSDNRTIHGTLLVLSAPY